MTYTVLLDLVSTGDLWAVGFENLEQYSQERPYTFPSLQDPFKDVCLSKNHSRMIELNVGPSQQKRVSELRH